MKSLCGRTNGTYTQIGDVGIPYFGRYYEIGFWGQRHRDYLKDNHRIIS